MTSRIVLVFPLALALGASAAHAFDVNGSPQAPADVEHAQLYNRPQADMLDEGPGGPAGGPDAAGLMTRLDRAEREMRQMTGRIEELQHKVQVLEEQLRASRPDAALRADAPARPTASTTPGASPAPPPLVAPGAQPRRGDAFDPAAAPNAPGAPRPLGTTSPSPPIAPYSAATPANPAPLQELGQPMDIVHGKLSPDPAAPSAADAIAPPPGPKEEYDHALASLHAGQYEAAEKSLSAFLVKNPKSKLAPAATFNLGESYFLRGRHREAAEKYLEISTKFAQSTQAPEAMLRLGQSLGALGAKEQACASFTEIGVKYPNAASRLKEAAQRESKKIQC